MKVYVKGSGTAIDLTQRDFVAQGGQASVYAKGDTAFKVYHDPHQALPIGKIQDLSVITDPRVNRPQQILVDKTGQALGYTTRFIRDAHVLCQLFPPAFRKREGITPDMTRDIIRQMQEGIAHVHAAGVLLVDLNEMNFLVSSDFKNVFFIDTDSYQTPHYPAPVLMDSVRDWSVHGHQWSNLSDWFSFGVVTFQLFVGIHPFKGHYQGPEIGLRSKLPTDAVDDGFAVTRRRMVANVSVFHPEVKVPAMVLPFNTIPPAYRAWYQALFVEGRRCPPPDSFGTIIAAAPKVLATAGTGALSIMELGTYEGNVSQVWSDGSHMVVATDQGLWLDGARVGMTGAHWAACGFAPRSGRALVAGFGPPPHDTIPMIANITDRVLVPFALHASAVMSHDGRIYVQAGDQVHEVVLTDAGSQVIASTKPVANILPHATRIYPGIVAQNLLGSIFVSLLVGPGQAQQIRIKELDGCKIIDAKYDSGVLMVVRAQKGSYDRIIFRFDGDRYDTRVVPNITPNGLNFIVLDSGVCVSLTEDDKLEIFSARMGSGSVKIIDDPILGADMVLAKQGGSVLFARGNKVYKMKMK